LGSGLDEVIFGGVLSAVLIVVAVILSVRMFAVLALGWYIMRTTGRTDGLADLAKLVRALMRR